MLQRMLKNIKSTYVESLSGLSREVWIISALMLITRAGLMVIPFLSIYLIEELNFTIIEAGNAAMFFGIGSICSALLGGFLTDLFGYKRVMQFSLLFGGMAFWTLLLADSYFSFCTLIFITSLLADLLRPAVMSSVSSYSKPENRTRAISLVRMAINFGIAIGPAVGGLLVVLSGYNSLFIVNGGTAIVAFIVFSLIMSSMVEQKTDDEENAIIESEIITAKTAYSDFYYIYLLFIILLMSIAFLQIIFAIPLFFKKIYGLSEAQVGLFFTINGLMIFFLEMPIVNFFEKRRKFYKPIVYGGVMMTIAYLGLLVPHEGMSILWILPFSIYTLFVGVGEILNLPFFNSLSLARSTKQNSGSYMGLFALVFSVSFAIMPKLGSFIIDNYGFDMLWIICAGLCLISTLLFHLSKDKFLISNQYN